MEKKYFIGTCVGNPFKTVNALIQIIDKGIKISRKCFIENCDLDERLIGEMKTYKYDYEYFNSGGIFFFTHSAIENFYK